jgi:hypothetical protein
MSNLMELDRIEVTWDSIQSIKNLAMKVNKVNLVDLPFHEGTLYVDCGKGKDSFAIYFNIVLLEFAMYIPECSTIVPSMEFKMNFNKQDLSFHGGSKKYWKKHKKGREMMGMYYIWVISALVYLLNPSLSKEKIEMKVVQKV